MYNNNLYNSQIFGIWQHSLLDTSSVLSYNGFSLKTDSIITSEIQGIDDMPDVNLATYNIAKSHGMGVNEYNFKKKKITIIWHIRGTDVSDAEKILVAMKSKMVQSGKALKYVRGDGEILTTTASCTAMKAPKEKRSLNVIPFVIELTTFDPFMYSSTVTESWFVGQTANISSSLAYESGGFDVEPIVFVTFNTANGVTQVDRTMNGATLSINESFSAGDVLKIDTQKKDILINDVGGKDYTGVFPKLSIGETPFNMDFNGAFDVDVYFQWRATYG